MPSAVLQCVLMLDVITVIVILLSVVYTGGSFTVCPYAGCHYV
jgi:hypothetical protein